MWVILMTLAAVASDIEIEVGGGDGVIVKATSQPVFVPACRGVSWARFNDATGRFETTNAETCGALSNAIKVGPEGQTFTVDVPLPPLPKVGFHLVRPTVVYGLKCKEEAPFPLAGCERIGSVDGPQIAVRSRGSAVNESVAKPE